MDNCIICLEESDNLSQINCKCKAKAHNNCLIKHILISNKNQNCILCSNIYNPKYNINYLVYDKDKDLIINKNWYNIKKLFLFFGYFFSFIIYIIILSYLFKFILSLYFGTSMNFSLDINCVLFSIFVGIGSIYIVIYCKRENEQVSCYGVMDSIKDFGSLDPGSIPGSS